MDESFELKGVFSEADSEWWLDYRIADTDFNSYYNLLIIIPQTEDFKLRISMRIKFKNKDHSEYSNFTFDNDLTRVIYNQLKNIFEKED